MLLEIHTASITFYMVHSLCLTWIIFRAQSHYRVVSCSVLLSKHGCPPPAPCALLPCTHTSDLCLDVDSSNTCVLTHARCAVRGRRALLGRSRGKSMLWNVTMSLVTCDWHLPVKDNSSVELFGSCAPCCLPTWDCTCHSIGVNNFSNRTFCL